MADDCKTKIFFHIKSLHSPQIEPKVGETVQVIAEPDTKGWKATVVSSPQRRAQVNHQQVNPKVQAAPKPSTPPQSQPNFQNQTLGKIVEWNDERGFGFIQTDNFKEKFSFMLMIYRLIKENFVHRKVKRFCLPQKKIRWQTLGGNFGYFRTTPTYSTCTTTPPSRT